MFDYWFASFFLFFYFFLEQNEEKTRYRMQDDGDTAEEKMTDAHSLLLQYFIAKRVDKDEVVREKYSEILKFYRGI